MMTVSLSRYVDPPIVAPMRDPLRTVLTSPQEDKIKTLTDAAGIKVEPYWPPMFARLLETVNMDDLISNIGAAPAAAPAGAPAGEAAEETKEEEKEESEEEEEEEMEFDLFD